MKILSVLLCLSTIFVMPSCSKANSANTNFVHTEVPVNLSPVSDPENIGKWVYQNALSDEFNETDFNRNVWHNMGEGGDFKGQWKGRAPSQYNPANIRVENGYLYLTSRWEPDYDFAEDGPRGNATSDIGYGDIAPVTTAALLGKNTYKFGYMEMRAKKADAPISSSFWTTGPGGETDAFESFGKNPKNRWSERRLHTSLHDWRKGSETYGKRIWDISHILDFRVADDFNIYGFEWDPNYLSIYINGGLVKCMSREDLGDRWVATSQHKIWIDSEIFDWEVAPNELSKADFGDEGVDFIVDYARVFKREGDRFGPGCEARENLIPNGDFESGVKGWEDQGVLTTESFQGENALRFEGEARINRTIKVKPNTLYLLSAAVSSDDTNMKDKWMNAYMGVVENGVKKNDVRFFFPTWKEKSLQFKTNSNTNAVTVYFTNSPQGGRMRLDNFVLTELHVTP